MNLEKEKTFQQYYHNLFEHIKFELTRKNESFFLKSTADKLLKKIISESYGRGHYQKLSQIVLLPKEKIATKTKRIRVFGRDVILIKITIPYNSNPNTNIIFNLKSTLNARIPENLEIKSSYVLAKIYITDLNYPKEDIIIKSKHQIEQIINWIEGKNKAIFTQNSLLNGCVGEFIKTRRKELSEINKSMDELDKKLSTVII